MSERSQRRETRFSLSQAPPPGGVRIVEVDGQRIGVFRVEGALYALADRCPHRGAPLCSSGEVVAEIAYREGSVGLQGEPRLVRCPWHKWEFDIATGRCEVESRLRVKRYSVRVEGDEVVVSLDSRAEEPPAVSQA